jgi:uncharacterized OsmC-like protein
MSQQSAMIIENPAVNGVNVGQVMEVIDSVQGDSANAQFQFRLDNEWIYAGLNRSRMQDFYANGREDDTRTEPFVLDADEPRVAAGQDTAPAPVEYVLHAMASCLTSTMVYHAAVQGIEIESVQSHLEGDMDVRGFFGLSEDVRKGFNKVRVRMEVKSPASAETLKQLALHSPVYDMIAPSLPVEVDLVKV